MRKSKASMGKFHRKAALFMKAKNAAKVARGLARAAANRLKAARKSAGNWARKHAKNVKAKQDFKSGREKVGIAAIAKARKEHQAAKAAHAKATVQHKMTLGEEEKAKKRMIAARGALKASKSANNVAITATRKSKAAAMKAHADFAAFVKNGASKGFVH